MKLTFVIPSMAGGRGRAICEFANGLSHRGHVVRILYSRSGLGIKQRLRELVLRMVGKNPGTWANRFLGDIREYSKLSPELVGCNDAVIGVSSGGALAISALPDYCGVKIQNCHGRELRRMDQMLQAWKLPMPNIVCSPHLEREIRKVNRDNAVYVVPNGIHREEYFPMEPATKKAGVGTVFHTSYAKDPDFLVEVFQRLHRIRPELSLMAFGVFPRPKGFPRTLKYTRFPSIADARKIYSSAQVWFCGSRSEGFPLSILEAMACGCAIVSTLCGGTDDQFEDGVSGYIVNPSESQIMVERILNLVDQEELRRRFVAASEIKLAQFTWPKAIDGFESALNGILAGNRNGLQP